MSTNMVEINHKKINKFLFLAFDSFNVWFLISSWVVTSNDNIILPWMKNFKLIMPLLQKHLPLLL